MSIKQDQLREAALRMHEEHQGKLAVAGKVAIRGQEDLSLAYSPGVAEPCLAIADNAVSAYRYTAKGNLVAVVSDGSAVLGLGNIGGLAGLPVMEGKSLLFKAFAGVDSFPLVLASQEPEQIVATVQNVAPTFGGINLEDISAPRCFEIEERLREALDIPVFHDDQHGTAIVVAAGLLNALKLTGKRIEVIRVVVEGAGAGGIAVSNLLLDFGVKDLTIVDTKGTIFAGRTVGMNRYKEEMAGRTNPRMVKGHLAEAMQEADVFVGLSVGETATREMVATMRPDPIIFACSNPVPEIWPDDALAGGAAVVGTGRSDYPNQLNNVLAFPGVFRGALDVRASTINEAMKRAAAVAIADLVSPEELRAEYIIPGPFDRRVAPAVAAAVAAAAVETGVARNPMSPEAVAEHCRKLVEEQQG
ncbi:MAG TPA: malic enzyme-like NAD(P)-binding protein [Symbiobacteriaceae bacterium]|jgi:malate dehydrogenase (oxaloacetate-decarboxylating)|nr:malic enzyme-like NAD(P)-binding protein [Symbiobacteriaceae bacterium]